MLFTSFPLNDIIDSQLTSGVLKNYNYDYLNAYIGKDSRTGGICLKGSIYEIRIYNKALTEEEIKHNYDVDKIRFEL